MMNLEKTEARPYGFIRRSSFDESRKTLKN
jgi:hypothetical protein